MRLRFTKMHGAGNDFVMINSVAQPFALDATQLQRLADRRYGVGADQILVVERPQHAGVDFGYRIFNADGGEVEQCGNGARCFVKFVHDQGLTTKRVIRVETLSGVIEPQLEDDGEVTVDMGVPVFEPARIPFDAEGLVARAENQARLWPLTIHGREVEFSVLSMGNPHAIQIVGDIEEAAVAKDGPVIEHHARFARRVNAGFMQVLDAHTVGLRVWERGVGETLSCGTGACAAVVAGILRGDLVGPVKVHTRGGQLRIAWPGPGHPVRMTGPATRIFEGEIDL